MNNKNQNYMKRTLLILTSIIALTMLSCKNNGYKDKLRVHYENLEPQEIHIKNYAKTLFSIDTANFGEELKKIQEEYNAFLQGDLNNPEAVNYLKAFATDTFCIRVNEMTNKKFSDIEKINGEIKAVCQHLNYYYPDINVPNLIYLYISGIDYQMPSVMIQSDAILISMDFYLDDYGIYDYVGLPRYYSLRCNPSYITRDLAQTIYSSYIERNEAQKDALTEMIKAGKRLYFVEALNPTLPDSIIMGYSSKQMQWAENYEADVWAALVGNNMLYSNTKDNFRALFGDGPFTQAFSNDAPARLGEYLGLQIIRSYMTNNDVSLQEMIRNNDIQQIFQASQYKPK